MGRERGRVVLPRAHAGPRTAGKGRGAGKKKQGEQRAYHYDGWRRLRRPAVWGEAGWEWEKMGRKRWSGSIFLATGGTRRGAGG
jgi:hypothetical protein